MGENFDCIVLGTGGVGSAALFHLASSGVRALGLDRFPPLHDRGSSHGDTRVIRQAYFEHPDYVPLLRRAYQLWSDLEQRAGKELYAEVGLLQAGPPRGVVVPGVRESARRHGLPVEELTAAEVRSRFPGFVVPEGMGAVFERRAGYLRVEDCVRAHAEEAVKAGAEIRVPVEVRGWRPDGSGVAVDTDGGEIRAGGLIITAGAWASGLLGELGVALEVRRKPLLWYRTASPDYRRDRGAPCFLFETARGIFYGFPEIDASGLKVAEHSGGERVEDPLTVDRSLRTTDREPVEAFMQESLPGVSAELRKHAVCLYTMSPDEHFVVDRHPRSERVAFAAGLSGHGFKFTSVLGEVLAELVLDGRSKLPIGFLGLGRAGLKDHPQGG